MAEPRTYSKARSIVAWIFSIYAAIIILINIPYIQSSIASWTAGILSRQLNTKVEIGSVNLGFFNNIVINDLYVEDQQGNEMLKVARVSASINLFTLITSGNIDISTAQLFSANANLYRQTPESQPNYQFVIDAFSSDDKESKPISININSLIVRHTNINYNVLSEPTTNTINPNHLSIRNGGFNLSLKQFTSDSINCSVKHFTVREENSKLNIKDLAFNLEGNNNNVSLSNFACSLPQSTLEIPQLIADISNFKNDKSFNFNETEINATITPSDFQFISPFANKIEDKFTTSISLSGNNKTLDIKKLLLNTESNSITADINALIANYTESKPSIHATVNQLNIGNGAAEQYAHLFIDNTESLAPVFNLGAINYIGNVSMENDAIDSDGDITTDAGKLSYIAQYNSEHILNANVKTTDLDLQRILSNDDLGIIDFSAEAIVDFSQQSIIPLGNIKSSINRIDYKSNAFSDITLNAINNASELKLDITSLDENANFALDAVISDIEKQTKTIVANLHAEHISPNRFGLTQKFANDDYKFELNSNINYTDLNHLDGTLSINDFVIKTADDVYTINNINIDALLNGTQSQHIDIHSDVADINLAGSFHIDQLASDFQNIIAHHMPAVVTHKQTRHPSDFDYSITFYDSPIVHHYIDADYAIDSSINIKGNLDSQSNSMNMQCFAPSITYSGNSFTNINANCSSSKGNLLLTLTGSANDDNSTTESKLIAIAHNNKIDTDLQLHNKAKDDVLANIFATTSFSKKSGSLVTDVNFNKSTIDINDSTWTISPSHLSYSNKLLMCDGFRIANGKQFIEINGRASSNPSDSLVVQLNDVQVAYILDLVNFHSVEFGGMASGKATVKNLFVEPDAHANLYVHDFSLQGGIMGDASILAHWDRDKEGIAINTHIADHYKSQYRLTGNMIDVDGTTEVNGYILPLKEYLDLHVLTNNTRADFLNGFLSGIIDDIDGRITGQIDVVGPFGDINLIGTPTAQMSMVLCATNVPYYIDGDSIHLRLHSFDFEDITIRDKQDHVGIFNGYLTHHNFADMVYSFDVDMTNLCAYNETEFNSDKFLAQFWANGDIHIKGSDGHPLTIDANVSPCKGSVFAYDSATPDALVSNSFIDFNDITDSDDDLLATKASEPDKPGTTSDNKLKTRNSNYRGDIYMNVNVELTPACEIKLRMDNTPDGYISTIGNGTFQAKWYNKGAFQLFGNYNITGGKYKLYLQDLVYRNLDIQEGSKVEFNGNPFDAAIHLICKHEIQSVPLSDLTSTKAFTSNNKVKVDCFLDITGHLDNMNLKFSFELPNVSEETRQLVRSMINSDEEMNKQMIYLLGFQRFYPNELAQNNLETYGTQAVNSLLSSTLSGQINQVLSNMIGSRSKWNFGTGIATGENGWQDLDVEGMLSGRLLNDRLLINGNFGYRDNALTNQANFIGDFEVKYRIWETGDFYAKAYNQTNDRYFTKATLNTQGIGLSFQHDFEKYTLFSRKKQTTTPTDTLKVTNKTEGK